RAPWARRRWLRAQPVKPALRGRPPREADLRPHARRQARVVRELHRERRTPKSLLRPDHARDEASRRGRRSLRHYDPRRGLAPARDWPHLRAVRGIREAALAPRPINPGILPVVLEVCPALFRTLSS